MGRQIAKTLGAIWEQLLILSRFFRKSVQQRFKLHNKSRMSQSQFNLNYFITDNPSLSLLSPHYAHPPTRYNSSLKIFYAYHHYTYHISLLISLYEFLKDRNHILINFPFTSIVCNTVFICSIDGELKHFQCFCFYHKNLRKFYIFTSSFIFMNLNSYFPGRIVN